MSLTVPKESDKPVPVLMIFGWTPFDPSPFGPGSGLGRGRGPRGPTKFDTLMEAGWGYAMLNPGTVQDDSGGWRPNPWLGRGDPNAASQEPTGAGLTRGIIGLTNLGQPRKPDQWGALRAWAWGASRGLDYLKEKMPAVNVDLLDGELAWRQHDGGHTDDPNIAHFVKWANRIFAERDAAL